MPTSEQLRAALQEAIERQKRVQEEAQRIARAMRATLSDERQEPSE